MVQTSFSKTLVLVSIDFSRINLLCQELFYLSKISRFIIITIKEKTIAIYVCTRGYLILSIKLHMQRVKHTNILFYKNNLSSVPSAVYQLKERTLRTRSLWVESWQSCWTIRRDCLIQKMMMFPPPMTTAPSMNRYWLSSSYCIYTHFKMWITSDLVHLSVCPSTYIIFIRAFILAAWVFSILQLRFPPKDQYSVFSSIFFFVCLFLWSWMTLCWSLQSHYFILLIFFLYDPRVNYKKQKTPV